MIYAIKEWNIGKNKPCRDSFLLLRCRCINIYWPINNINNCFIFTRVIFYEYLSWKSFLFGYRKFS